jgi:serine/threonine protein phosphatase PrpC
VFDGHGPRGHKFAQSIRDNLPSKLSTTIKMSQQNVSNEDDANATNKNTSNDSWEEQFCSSFNQMDEHLAKNVDTDGLCGGCVAITLIKQVNMFMSSIFFFVRFINIFSALEKQNCGWID